MRFLIAQFLVLILAAAAVGQAPVVAGEAEMVDSFGRVPTGDLRGRLDYFLNRIANRGEGTRGIVVNYGTVREVVIQQRLFSNHFGFRNFDPSKISFVRGGNVSEWRTDLWVVPAGAKQPRIEPEAFVAAEFGRVTRNRARGAIRKYFVELNNVPDHQGYIIVYGTAAQMNMQERWILSEPNLRRCDFDCPRITIVRGGKRKNVVGTVMWLIPPGAANPTP